MTFGSALAISDPQWRFISRGSQSGQPSKASCPLLKKSLHRLVPDPHWAKLFTVLPARLTSRYAKMPDYKAMLAQYDPNGKFRNEFISKNIYGR
jgi:hypothetical protein